MAKIPALTLSGGRLSDYGGIKAVKEFRVWVHPVKGDEYYYSFKTLAGATRKYRSLRGYREPPIAVVWDKKYRKYREVVINRRALIDAGYSFPGGKLKI